MSKYKIRIYKLYDDAITPSFGTGGAACFDIHLFIENAQHSAGFKINPGQRVTVGTGLIFDIDEGWHMKVYSRSGNASKRGLMLLNGVGVIDSDYTHELKLILYNASSEQIILKHGDRIAQAEMVEDSPYYEFETLAAPPLPKGDRVGGCGSTGGVVGPESVDLLPFPTEFAIAVNKSLTWPEGKEWKDIIGYAD